MTRILKVKWHGIVALTWLLFGFGVTSLLLHSFGSPGSYYTGFVIWLLLGWITPVLRLGFSGLHQGPLVSRVGAILALVGFAALALHTLIPRVGH